MAQAGGNSTLALLLTVICNMTSVFTAPPMISWLMKFKGVKLDFVQLLIKLVLTVLLPLVVSLTRLILAKLKLNPLRARWPMEPVLISSFCSVKQVRVFDSPWMGH